MRAGHRPLSAYKTASSVKESELLNRLAGYLRVYRLVTDTPTNESALEWLSGNPAVEQKGLLEGVALFRQQRPQPK